MGRRLAAVEDLVNDPSFWRGRRVFLTGHTGFKGAWLVLTLKAWGAEIHGYALPPGEPSLYASANVGRCMAAATLADIADRDALESALAESEAEVVIHMAAQPLVRLSYDEPVKTFATNVMGTVHLLDAVRRQPSVRACVVVTSDKCYENREWVWSYRENEAMGGFDPYSSSKGAAELVTSAYRRSFFEREGAARIGSGRAGNVIGGGDWAADRLVPDLIRSIRAGVETPIRHPHAIRPWQHVLEPLSGYLALAEALCADDGVRHADGWNFGPTPEAERTAGDIVAAICTRWGPDARWRLDGREHVHEAGFLKLDSSKARRHLGWTPTWNFDETLDATVDWYRADAEGADMTAFTMGQIERYFAAAGRAVT